MSYVPGTTDRSAFSDPSATLNIPQPDDGLIGIRQWGLAVSEGRMELGSTYSGSTWVPGGRFPAECVHGHRTGNPSCTCGFYGTRPTLSDARNLERSTLSNTSLVLTGACRSWGQVTVEAEVMRSEFARVEALFTHAHHDPAVRSLIEQLAERYEAELVNVSSAAEIVDWTTTAGGALTPGDLESLLKSAPITMLPIDRAFTPLYESNLQPTGFWPSQAGSPLSPEETELPTASNPLGIYPVAGMRYHPGRKPEHDRLFQPSAQLTLIPEPHNPHDRNAIAVYDRSGEVQLGYLPRRIAEELSPQEVRQSRAYLLCTWSDQNSSELPTSAHVLVLPEELADRLEFVRLPTH